MFVELSPASYERNGDAITAYRRLTECRRITISVYDVSSYTETVFHQDGHDPVHISSVCMKSGDVILTSFRYETLRGMLDRALDRDKE